MRRIRVDKATRKYEETLAVYHRQVERHEKIEDAHVRSRLRIIATRRRLDFLRKRIDKGAAPVEATSPVDAAIAKLAKRRAKR